MKLYIGAGKDRKEGYIHADIVAFEGIDKVFDATKEWPFLNCALDKIYSQDFLEHIPQDKAVFVIKEAHRVLKVGGVMEHVIPNAGSNNDFASPTHLSHWNLWTFRHFTAGDSHFETDKEFMGWDGGGFEPILMEETNVQGGIAQSIHVIMRKL